MFDSTGQYRRDCADDFILNGEYVVELSIISFRPQMGASFRRAAQ
jgi:hypothetical protein